MLLKQKLLETQKHKSALLAVNFYNLETLQGILAAASELHRPVILQLSPASIAYIGLNTSVSLARAAMMEYDVEGWLHLDHASSVRAVSEALDAGFDSVMIDASDRPLNENIKITRQAVDLAKSYNACVEAELGYVAKLGESQSKKSLTVPSEAKLFADETGVDTLAVAIGSAHGFYRGEPGLDLDLLSEISRSASVPLVLHGASGIPDITIKEAVLRGICKINLATETKQIFMNTLKQELARSSEIDLRKIFPPAIHAVRALIISKLKEIPNSQDAF